MAAGYFTESGSRLPQSRACGGSAIYLAGTSIPPTPCSGVLNFLAHLYLAEATDESLIGNFLGDFVKGTPESLRGRYPEAVIRGIRKHRAIDAFTDSHPTFRKAKALLEPHRRRLAGIVVDVFYDYFLSSQWPGGKAKRLEFIRECHETLSKPEPWLPENFRAVIPRMITENWLGSYASLEGLALTFRRVSTRAPVAVGVLGAEQDLIGNEKAFGELYSEFFPDLCEFANNWE